VLLTFLGNIEGRLLASPTRRIGDGIHVDSDRAIAIRMQRRIQYLAKMPNITLLGFRQKIKWLIVKATVRTDVG